MRHKTEYHLIQLGSVTSTNDEVLARARQFGEHALRRDDGRFVPLVVMSDRQTAGRGRLGRSWASPPGGLYFSALVEVAVPQEGRRAQGEAVLDLASLSLVAALAIRAALQSFAASDLRVKWPNDIVTAKGKLVGISLELKQSHAVFPGSLPFGTAGAAGVPVPVQAPALAPTLAPTLATASHYAVIGVGINVKRPSEGAFEGAAYLDDDATEQLPFDKIAQEAINTLLDRYGKWAGGHGLFAPFAEEYHAHMTLLGESVCVRDATGAEIAQGAVEGVDEKGQLLLAGEAGLVAVTAGEVTLRNPRAPSCCSGR